MHTQIELNGATYLQYPNGHLVPIALVEEKVCITTATHVFPLLADLAEAKQEHVVMFSLDGHNQVIKRHIVTIGLANQSQIHPREVFKPAIMDHAVCIIVAHNHPSGHLSPSEADLKGTKRLTDAGKLLGVPLLDHCIFSNGDIYSIREFYPECFSA